MMQYNENWSEFRWEKELRNDEKRIHGYFKTLPRWIDLPHEEEAIFDNLMHRPDLVPLEAMRDARSRFAWEYGEPEYGDEPERPPQAEILDKLDHLALEWGVLAVSEVGPADFRAAMSLSCRFGKLQLRVEDMLNAAELPRLRRSLAKRVLADLNDLSGDIGGFARRRESLAVPLTLIGELLQGIREEVVDILVKEAR